MTIQLLAGASIQYPALLPGNGVGGPTLANSSGMTASTHELHVTGYIWHKDRANNSNIVAIHWTLGNITTSDTTVLGVGLFATDTAAGPPARATGAALTSGTVTTSALTTAAWNSCSVTSYAGWTHGGLYTVKFSYSSYSAASLVPLRGWSMTSGTISMPHPTYYNGSTYAVQALLPSLIFEHADGTFSSFRGAQPVIQTNTHAVQASNNPDEYGNVFQLPFPIKADGCWVIANPASANADMTVGLYENPLSGTTAAIAGGAVSFDASTFGVAAARLVYISFTQAASLSANTNYALAFRGSGTAQVTTYSFDVNAAAHMQTLPGGQTWQLTNRDGGTGNFAAGTTTSRHLSGLMIAGADDATGGGGGGGMRLAGIGGLAA